MSANDKNRAKAHAISAAAWAIIDADKAKQDAKTERLRKAQLDRAAGDLLAHAPGKPKGEALKAQAKRSV